MDQPNESPSCSSSCGCHSNLDRREFVQLGLGAAAALASAPFVAGPFAAEDFSRLIPEDKKLSPEWIKSLTARGDPTVYHGPEVEKIGMPIGGLCAGQVYLGGDGKLWHWDIFNRHIPTGAEHYAQPPHRDFPVDQGFALRVDVGGKVHVRTLDRQGFPKVSFRGEYPIGFIDYRDADFPIAVQLEAFSPFMPLSTDDSGLPATVLKFTVKNTAQSPADVQLAGWLENAVCDSTRDVVVRRNRIVRRPKLSFLECSAELPPSRASRPPVVFAAFDGDDYGDWKVEGTAFGKGPARGQIGPQRLTGQRGKGLVNTYAGSDEPRGKLISPEFAIERPYISFLIGGGKHPGQTCINLRVAGQIVRTATGKDSDQLELTNWDVRDLAGRKARLEIVDDHSGGWGHIDIDQIEFRDEPALDGPLMEQPDFGTMGLALLKPASSDFAIPSLPRWAGLPPGLFTGSAAAAPEAKPGSQKLRGALGRKVHLQPGEQAEIVFLVTWHFPNLGLPGFQGTVGRHYAGRFTAAIAVAQYLADHFERLTSVTELWHRTWYDSTLPYWLLDRLFANTSTLATSTCYRFRNGRFYGWEGVGCCGGTCTHVWHYAHAAARLFPELERLTRERIDFGVALDPRTGIIDHRAEFKVGPAIDGQAGTILRAYREHQMSADDSFLRGYWSKIKKALEYLINCDGNGDGIIEGAQHNTLDAEWFGQIPWLSSLYVAALQAGAAMAREIGDSAFAATASTIAECGRRNIDKLLWNGNYRYYIQLTNSAARKAVGSFSGCHIDQVLGQSWAFQVHLGRILDPNHVRAALRSLWRYNFTPDVGPFRAAHKPGRWYAMPGEGGLIMVTFPHEPEPRFKDHPSAWSAMYFNECMSGFEYQVAGHMVWEGLLTEGLAICRVIHERYHAARRNPWNEVECGDHYARAMSSYGVYLALCGYEYHGPKGYLGFAPRISPEDFRAAFTAAEGWGTFSQKWSGRTQQQSIQVHWGRLRLRTLAFELPADSQPTQVAAELAGNIVPSTFHQDGNRLTVHLTADTTVLAGQELRVRIK